LKVLGIIAEYNPFHKGHLYHLTESKLLSEADVCVAVMSGNFVQRGEAAMLSKWERAAAAVGCGIDLALELPFIYACNNAELFARGAVRILNGLNCVDYISFGSESGDLTELTGAARAITSETENFKKSLKEHLDRGVSFPRARALAVMDIFGEETSALLESPNNILAAEYLKQLSLTDSQIVPLTVKRKGHGDNSLELDGEFAGAAAIRRRLAETESAETIGDYVPGECFEFIKKYNIDINKMINTLFLLISAKIFTENEGELGKILSAGEGLESKLLKEIRGCDSLEALISRVKSKRYTRTRIQRLLIHTLFGLNSEEFWEIEKTGLIYTRVLAFNEKGAALLKKIKAGDPQVPVVTNINKQAGSLGEMMKILRYDIAAGDIYNLISGGDIRRRSDYTVAPHHKF